MLAKKYDNFLPILFMHVATFLVGYACKIKNYSVMTGRPYFTKEEETS